MKIWNRKRFVSAKHFLLLIMQEINIYANTIDIPKIKYTNILKIKYMITPQILHNVFEIHQQDDRK